MIMKKLGKLSLKELSASTFELTPQEANSIIAGSGIYTIEQWVDFYKVFFSPLKFVSLSVVNNFFRH